MKRMLTILCVLLILLSGCGKQPPQPPAQEEVTLKWFLPGKGSYPDSQTVFTEANQLIQTQFPNLHVEFHVINKYQYAEKLSLSLAAREQVDLAWTNDRSTPYLTEINKNNFKILSDYIDRYGQDIKSSMPEEVWQAIQRSDRVYFIPSIYSQDGMIPFLQIPRSHSVYLDVRAFSAAVNQSDLLTRDILDPLSDYLAQAASARQLQSGIDAEALLENLPLKGYEQLLSLSGLIGYQVSDPDYRLCDMTSTPERKLAGEYLSAWREKGYILKNPKLKNPKKLNEPNHYILSVIWGYYNESGMHTVLDDDVTDDYLYIPLDTRAHQSRLIADAITFVPRNSNYPAEAVKVLNLLHQTPDLYRTLTYGIENTNYTLDENHAIRVIGDPPAYAMYPNLLPHAPNQDIGIPYRCIVPTSLTPYHSRLLNFQPTSSGTYTQINQLLTLYQENPETDWSENDLMQQTLKELQAQTDLYLAGS